MFCLPMSLLVLLVNCPLKLGLHSVDNEGLSCTIISTILCLFPATHLVCLNSSALGL